MVSLPAWQQPPARRAIALFVVVSLGVLLLIRFGQFFVGTTYLAWGFDFSAYWLAASNILESGAIYSADQLAGPYTPQRQFLYLYPPPFAVFATPLAALFNDYRHAAWLWAGLGAGVLVGSVVAVARREGTTRPAEIVVLVAAAFALGPVIFELLMGNVHLLLVGLLSFAWLRIRDGTRLGEVAAGAAVGAAALIKIFPALLLLWFVVTGRSRAALAALVTVAGLALITAPVTGIGAWIDYPTVLANAAAPTPNTTIGPTAWLTDAIGFTPARIAVIAVGMGIVVWSARSQPAVVSYAVAVMVSVLVVPTLYPHYLAVIVLPLLLAFAIKGWTRGPAMAYLALLVGGQFALADLNVSTNLGLATIGALLPLGVLLAMRRTSTHQPGGGATQAA